MFNGITCEKCGARVSVADKAFDTLKCRECGAYYIFDHEEVEKDVVKKIYNFKGFRCIYSFDSSDCDNFCLASEMFCEEHTSDEHFKSIKDSINYLERRLNATKRTLERMEESKKLILIQKVSGAYEEDSVIWEDKDQKS